MSLLSRPGILKPAGIAAICVAAGCLPLGAQGWLVLPFANQSGESSLDWLGNGFAISVEELLRGAGQHTIANQVARGITADWDVPAGRALSLASALKAADQAGADRVVTGVFRLHEGELRVEAQVLDPEAPALRGRVEESARLGDLLDLYRGLARSILRAGEDGLPSQKSVRDSSPTPPLSAYEQYVRALILPQAEQRLQALRLAARNFPNYALLQYRLAEELHEAGRDDEALSSLDRVREVRFSLSPEAQLLRAEILLERGESAPAAAAADAALDLRETYRGRLLRAEALITTGSVEQARTDLERARQLGAPTEDCDALLKRLPAPVPATP
jgi:tetratricopeptide (TPR) repeat protein